MQLRQVQCLVSSAAASVERALLWPGDDNPEKEAVALLKPVESIVLVLGVLAKLQLPDHLRSASASTQRAAAPAAKAAVSDAPAADGSAAAATSPSTSTDPLAYLDAAAYNIILPCPDRTFRLLITPEPPLPFLKRRTAASVAWLLMAQATTCLGDDSLENRCPIAAAVTQRRTPWALQSHGSTDHGSRRRLPYFSVRKSLT